MTIGCFADRVGELIRLTAPERAALSALEERERHVRRNGVLFREKDTTSELFIIRRGLMMNYVLLDDGSRQILRFLFPGDMAGTGGLVYRGSPETTMAMTDTVVCGFEREALGRLMRDHPRLGGVILAVAQIERVALTDRLAALGRRPAKSRVAALLLDMRNRYRALDNAIGATFVLGLTQEEIGDATGLTAVHVNRMLRQLEDERLISRDHGRLHLLNEPALRRAANYTDRYENIDVSWLPAAVE